MNVPTNFDRDVFRGAGKFSPRYWCVVLLFVFNGCRPSTHIDTPQEGREVLAITPPTVVIERSADGDESAVVVSIKNVSSRAFDFGASPAGCACSLVVLPKVSHLEPGESTELKLSAQPPVYGQSTTTFALKTSHPLLPLRQISVVLRGKEQPISYVLSKPDSIQLSASAGQTPAKVRWTVSCVEYSAERPWLRGMFADDSRIEITDPIIEESPPTSDSTLVRHYAFEATLIESPHDAKPFRLPLRWTFEKAEAGDAARPILMGVEVVPYLRVVPDPIVIDATANQVATIERQCLLFFNNDARQTIAFPEQFPSGVTAIMAPDQSKLPENASRLLLRIEPQSLQRSTHSDSMSDLSIPVTVTNGKNQNGVIKIRLVRR